MGDTREQSSRQWAGRPRVARLLRFVVWLVPIVVSVVSTHFLSKGFPRPPGLFPAVAWFVGLCVIATVILLAVDKVARRLLPLAALLQLSLVFPDSAPSRFKAALRTQSVRQLELRVAEIKESGLSNDPAIAAETLIELIAALSAHDRLTRGHAERVRAYSRMIGEELKLSEKDLDLLQWAGLAHDVGKLFVPGEILNKTSRLTDEEFDVIKQHPGWGAELCEPLRPWLGDWVNAVGEHHERWDGKGYPKGLAGTDISLAARIVSVADVYDVITSIRSYKSAGTSAEAREELARCAGTQFDERMVRAFLNISLGRLRLAMGPLSWLAQVPIVAQMPLVPVVGAAASVAVTGGAMLVGGTFAGAEVTDVPDVPAAVAAPLPETTLPEPLPPTTVPLVIVATPRTTVPVPVTTGLPATTTTSTTDVPTTTSTEPAVTTTVRAATTTSTTTTTTTVPPLIATNRSMVVTEDNTIEIDVGNGGGVGVVARVVSGAANGTIEHRGGTLFAFRGGDDFNGQTSFEYEIRDAFGRISNAVVTISVSPTPDEPRAANDVAAVDENGTVEISVLDNDMDPDGDPLTIVAVSSGDGVVTTNGTTIVYSPATHTFGTHRIEYIIGDGTGRSDRGIVTVAVSPVNSRPNLVDPGVQSVNEGATLSFTVTATDDDVPAQSATFTLTSGLTPVPAGATIDPDTGVFSWMPTEAQGGTSYSFKLRVTDDGSPNLFDEVEVGFNVTDLNEAPVLDPIGNRTVDEGASLALTLTATDVDLPVDALTFSATGLPAGATLDAATGVVAWTPTEAQGGTDFTVTFTVTDNGVGARADSETLQLTATEVNEAPTLTAPGDQTGLVGEVISLTISAADVDVPANNLAFAAIGLPAGLGIDVNTGVISGTPTTIESTTVTVTVAETDGSPTNLSANASFDWNITPANVLISEIATSGPGGDLDEFIELYNPTTSTISIAGWELRRSDGDMSFELASVIPAGVSIGANEYFLISHDSVHVALGADAWYSSGQLDPGAGVGIFTNTGVVVDAVGTGPVPWKDGAGSLYGEGTHLPPLSGSVAQSYERKRGVGNCVDTDDNSADFFHNMGSRNPQGLGSTATCGTPTPPTPPATPNHLVISEFRFDGPAGGDDEFVEIFNPTALPISLLGYELRNQGGGGGLEAVITVGDLARLGTGFIGPGKHLVFGSPSYDGSPQYGKVDIRTSGNIKNDEGVYLVAPAVPLVSPARVVDAVSTGGSVQLEGTPLPPISGRVIHSYERLLGGSGGNCYDTDVNVADFFHNMGSENPQRLSAPATPCV